MPVITWNCEPARCCEDPAPTEPKLIGRFCAFAQAMKPCRSRAGTAGGITTMFGTSAIMPTAAKSRSGSKGSDL